LKYSENASVFENTEVLNIVVLKLKYSPKLWFFSSIGERGLTLFFFLKLRKEKLKYCLDRH
jgi:hypothetical protein